MANGMRDPWNTEYHGYYITNAGSDPTNDNKDRGAIVMYSDGPNNVWGSKHEIANGIVTITNPGNSKDGKDDYALVSCYTFTNGYGETKTITSGFSNNQNLLDGSGAKPGVDTPDLPNINNEYEMLDGSNQVVDGTEDVVLRSAADFDKFDHVEVDDVLVDESNYTVTEGSTVITLKKEYIQTLSYGTHVVKIVSDDGKASANIYFEEKVSIEQLSAGKFKMFDGSGMSFAIVNGSIELYNNNSVVSTIPSELVTINNNVVTITGTGTFDGTYTICEDGYVELNGQLVAKSEQMWVDLQQNLYFIKHSNKIYISEDGNTIIEEYLNLNDVRYLLESMDDETKQFYADIGYEFANIGDNITLENVYDSITLSSLMQENPWFILGNGKYRYNGGLGMNYKTDTELVEDIFFQSTDLNLIKTTSLQKIVNDSFIDVYIDNVLDDGLYIGFATQQYYHENELTENVFYVDDYPLYFEDGMTYRDWMNKYGPFVSLDDVYCEYVPYIYPEYVEQLCKSNQCPGVGVKRTYMTHAFDPYSGCFGCHVGPQEGNVMFEVLPYEQEGFEFNGLWYGFGEKIITGEYFVYDIFNYFYQNGYEIPSSINMFNAFTKNSNESVIDISSYLTARTLHVGSSVGSQYQEEFQVDVDWDSLCSDLGISKVDNAFCFVKDNNYYVKLPFDVVLEDYDGIKTHFKNREIGVAFYYNGTYYEGFVN